MISNNAFGLFYNKNLFDRFGVPYPKDGMTWEEVRNLAAKVNRNVDGVQYVGLHPGNVTYGARQLNLPWFDVKNNKAAFQSQEWKDLFQMWSDLYKLPGGDVIPNGTNFTKSFYEGKIAMIAGYSILIGDMLKTRDLPWDVVTYPTNPKAPGVGSSVDPLATAISSASKHKTEAFQVLSVILSDEVQLDMSRNAMMSVLKDLTRETLAYNFGAHEIMVKVLADFKDAQQADGRMPFVYPASVEVAGPDWKIPEWVL